MVAMAIVYGESSSEQALHHARIMSNRMQHRGTGEVIELEFGSTRGVISVLANEGARPSVRRSAHACEIADSMLIVSRSGDTEAESDPETLHVTLHRGGIAVTRGNLYMRGAFYSVKDNQFYFATERKALFAIGMREAIRLEPGGRIQFSPDRGIECQSVDPLQRSELKEYDSEKTIINRLREPLLRSFQRLQGLDLGVLFSGGVDSGLVAHLSKRVAKRLTLYSVSARGSHDEEAATDAAKLLQIPLKSITIDESDVWSILPEVIYAIEDSNRMNVAIALPFLVATRAAKEDGYGIMLSGQGPDEMFAGYARHVRIMEEEGPVRLNNELWREISITHKANLERDESAVAYGGCEVIFPYLFRDFLVAALEIHSRWKVKPRQRPVRKYIFRHLAEDLGLPPAIAEAPKRATQFSSRTDRLIAGSIHANIGTVNGLSRKESDTITQTVLDRIAMDLGLSDKFSLNEKITDWRPVEHLLSTSPIRQL